MKRVIGALWWLYVRGIIVAMLLLDICLNIADKWFYDLCEYGQEIGVENPSFVVLAFLIVPAAILVSMIAQMFIDICRWIWKSLVDICRSFLGKLRKKKASDSASCLDSCVSSDAPINSKSEDSFSRGHFIEMLRELVLRNIFKDAATYIGLYGAWGGRKDVCSTSSCRRNKKKWWQSRVVRGILALEISRIVRSTNRNVPNCGSTASGRIRIRCFFRFLAVSEILFA